MYLEALGKSYYKTRNNGTLNTGGKTEHWQNNPDTTE